MAFTWLMTISFLAKLLSVCLQHGIGIFTEVPTPIKVERKIGDVFRHEQVLQGDVVIVPAGTTNQTQWYGSGGVVILGFEPAIFNRAIYEIVEPEKVELAPYFATFDPFNMSARFDLEGRTRIKWIG
jgi:AraC family transcriptional regulator